MTIKEARNSTKLTQAQVAKVIGVTLQCYQNYEYGITFPNVMTALKLAKLFGTSVEELFGKKTEM